MIKFNCDNCGRKFSAPESYAGKKGRCPKCKNVVFIPDARKSGSSPQENNSGEPQNDPRYSDFDLTLLEVPQIGEAQEKIRVFLLVFVRMYPRQCGRRPQGAGNN